MAGRRINPIEPTKSLLLRNPQGSGTKEASGLNVMTYSMNYFEIGLLKERLPIQVVPGAWELRFTLRQDVC